MSFPLQNLGRVAGFADYEAVLPCTFSSPGSGRSSPLVSVLLDSGATISVAPAGLASGLGLPLASGEPLTLQGVGGSVVSYVHVLDITVNGTLYRGVPVAVSQSDQVPFLLGRLGFWDEASFRVDNSARTLTLTSLGGVPAAQSAPPPGAGALGLLLLFALGIGAYFVATSGRA